MISRPPTGGTLAQPKDLSELTPEEQEAFEAGLERVEIEKARALADPGPTWREWFFYDHAKWWVGLGFLIVDVWVGGAWFTDGAFSTTRLLGAVATVVPAFYVEALLYRYLWRRPSDTELRKPGPFRRTVFTLREFGRWTPESDQIRAGKVIRSPDGGPNLDEFL